MHRPSEDQEMKLRFNHRGRFVTFPMKLYVEGCVYEMEDTVDANILNYEDIKKRVLNFGYMKFKCLWYQHPRLSFQHGLKLFLFLKAFCNRFQKRLKFNQETKKIAFGCRFKRIVKAECVTFMNLNGHNDNFTGYLEGAGTKNIMA